MPESACTSIQRWPSLDTRDMAPFTMQEDACKHRATLATYESACASFHEEVDPDTVDR